MRDSRDRSARDAWTASFAGLDLAGLGWARASRSLPVELWSEHPESDPARVVRVDRGRMLLVARGDGSLQHVRDRSGDGGAVVVGDWVLVDRPALDAGGFGFARLRVPRAGTLARRRPDESTAPQVLAANVDLVLVAEALEPGRELNVGRVTRLVALAGAGGCEALVVLTGVDRIDDTTVASLPRTVAGTPVVATSIVDGRGLDALGAWLLPGTTAVAVGASGAGKSSLANALVDADLLAVGERRGSGTGRHTTSVGRLVPLPGGALLVDTPGIRTIGMHADVDVGALAPASLDEHAASCRFGDCGHGGEPGCAVQAAIDDGRLPADAVREWRKLEREARRERARADKRLQRELRTEWRNVGREVERARRRGEIPERRR